MKILFAVDGSPHAHATVETMARELDVFRERPQVTLMYVHPPLPYKRAVAWAGKEVVAEYYADESAAALADAVATLTARGVAFATETRVGDPSDELVRFAEDGGYDLIVMGTHGHGALANLVLGSVATKVLAKTKMPVLFLR
jgi:nucleotide-binding universal stress UspA family protein